MATSAATTSLESTDLEELLAAGNRLSIGGSQLVPRLPSPEPALEGEVLHRGYLLKRTSKGKWDSKSRHVLMLDDFDVEDLFDEYSHEELASMRLEDRIEISKSFRMVYKGSEAYGEKNPDEATDFQASPETTAERTYELRAVNQEEKRSWMRAIRYRLASGSASEASRLTDRFRQIERLSEDIEFPVPVASVDLLEVILRFPLTESERAYVEQKDVGSLVEKMLGELLAAQPDNVPAFLYEMCHLHLHSAASDELPPGALGKFDRDFRRLSGNTPPPQAGKAVRGRRPSAGRRREGGRRQSTASSASSATTVSYNRWSVSSRNSLSSMAPDVTPAKVPVRSTRRPSNLAQRVKSAGLPPGSASPPTSSAAAAAAQAVASPAKVPVRSPNERGEERRKSITSALAGKTVGKRSKQPRAGGSTEKKLAKPATAATLLTVEEKNEQRRGSLDPALLHSSAPEGDSGRTSASPSRDGQESTSTNAERSSTTESSNSQQTSRSSVASSESDPDGFNPDESIDSAVSDFSTTSDQTPSGRVKGRSSSKKRTSKKVLSKKEREERKKEKRKALSKSKDKSARRKGSRGEVEIETASTNSVIGTIYDIYNRFFIGKTLGQGRYATVKLGVEIETNEKYAIKIISKNRLGIADRVREEFNILKTVDHPNIVRFSELYEDANRYYMVIEYVSGGELFERIVSSQYFNESLAREISRKLIAAVGYLHDRGIVHRDIKPQNILCALDENNDITGIKLADFGVSKMLDDQQSWMKTFCGTPKFIAPEVLMKKYQRSADMWSVGTIIYLMLCGYAPFEHESTFCMYELIKGGTYDFDQPIWESISIAAKDLISKLLVVDPTKRLSAKDALMHEWFTGPSQLEDITLQPSLLHLQKFTERSSNSETQHLRGLMKNTWRKTL